MSHLPISFPGWKGVLTQASLSQGVKAAYAREIITFLHHCKVRHAAATVELAKQYLSEREKQSPGPAHSTGSEEP